MVALKGRDIERFMAAPHAGIDAVLVYGPDRGLVAERARKLLSHYAADPADPFAVSILDEADVARAPERLMDELGAIGFGGGRRTVFVRAAGSAAGDAIAAALANERAANLIVEAGELRPQSALRKAFEAAANAAALPCYIDDDRALDSLIDEVLSAAGQYLDDPARRALHSRLGADRGASRAELEKLSLYAGAGGAIGIEDVAAACADVAASTLDAIVDAMAEGRLDELEREVTKAGEGGIDPPRILTAALRHMQGLHRASAAIGRGTAPASAIDALRPPVFFARRDSVVRQLRRWSEPELRRGLSVLADAARAARLSGARNTLAARALLQAAMLPRSRS